MTTSARPVTPPSDVAQAAVNHPVRPAHLVALVRQVSARSRGRVIAVRAVGPWTGRDELSVDGERWRVVRAASVLAAREALADLEATDPDARLVLLTSLGEKELGLDVLARVARQKVWELQSWELLRDLFRARDVDPRVAQHGWLVNVLLEQAPTGGYQPAPSGILDLDTAWTQALALLLGMHGGAPDALTILRWSVSGSAAERWSALPADARSGIAERFEQTAGDLGRVLARSAYAGYASRLVALGLVADVLWSEAPSADMALRESVAAARVRIEPLVGGMPLAESVARQWAGLAGRVLGELSLEEVERQRAAAEATLADLRAEPTAALSRVLPAGAARRAAALARAIRDWVDDRATPSQVAGAHHGFVEHTDVVRDPARVERARMAVRLVRAMSTGAPAETSGFGESVRHHVRWWSWVDAARTGLIGGDLNAELSAVYELLLARTRVWREAETQRFAERLVTWNTQPVAEPDVLPVERIIEQIVAPISRDRDVLVLLLDGLDLNVWRGLMTDVAARGWTWWQPSAAAIPPVGIATLPSVTAYSRASLFAGMVKEGHRDTEREDFAQHPSLRRTGGRAPVLFHKGELGSANALALPVRTAVASRQLRVVGAVVNAVDDWLSRSDQTLPRWSVAAIPLLDSLLQEAVSANRVVIVVSDHGHILDFNTRQHGRGVSARWRLAENAPAGAGEIVATGRRVREATGNDSVILASSETIRYAGRQAGYHGGASAQEVVAPIAVLSREELGVAGWRPVVDLPPTWWEDIGYETAASVTTSSRRPTPPRPPVAPVAPTGELRSTAPDWIDAVLASPVYAAQRSFAGRMAPRDEQMRVVLEMLHRYQDRAPRAAVAAALGLPDVRVRGLVASVRRVLNVEGFAVIEEQESTGTLLLNRALLGVQFGVAT
jgi:hypothetical protein